MTYKDLLINLQLLSELELNQKVIIMDDDDNYNNLENLMYCEYSNEGSLNKGQVFFKLYWL